MVIVARMLCLAALMPALALAAFERSPAPADAAVYFISPTDGATVTSPLKVRFGLSNMGVAPAGVVMDKTGHHHLLINTSADDLDLTQPLPATKQVMHFGMGQTEVTLELEAGTHRLQLLLGNHLHIPHDPAVHSEIITITVE
jgi:hypothetical protein